MQPCLPHSHRYLTPPRVLLKLLAAPFYLNKFFDERGNAIYLDEYERIYGRGAKATARRMAAARSRKGGLKVCACLCVRACVRLQIHLRVHFGLILALSAPHPFPLSGVRAQKCAPFLPTSVKTCIVMNAKASRILACLVSNFVPLS